MRQPTTWGCGGSWPRFTWTSGETPPTPGECYVKLRAKVWNPLKEHFIMARRHDALIPLTHDHHHALVQASALIAASEADEPARVETARTFHDFYRRETLLHFHEEEEILFPRLLESVDSVPQALINVLVDHVRIHGMVIRLKTAIEQGDVGTDQLKELGERLRAHIRLEERELFPLIERSVPQPVLGAVNFAERNRSQ
jgi:hemerythrin-like domain-containing protein